VNLIAPGDIDTAMTRSVGQEFVDSVIAGTPLGRLGEPGEIALWFGFWSPGRLRSSLGRLSCRMWGMRSGSRLGSSAMSGFLLRWWRERCGGP
jgi:hypothetical protein